MEKGNSLPQGGLPLSPVPLPAEGAEDVLPDGHIWKKGAALEQVSHAAPLGREVDPRPGIKEGHAVQNDAAPVGPLNPGDALEGEAFPAAGGAQKAEHAAVRVQRDAQVEAAQPLFKRGAQAHGRTLLPSRRLTAISTAALIARLTSTQKAAPEASLVRQSW